MGGGRWMWDGGCLWVVRGGFSFPYRRVRFGIYRTFCGLSAGSCAALAPPGVGGGFSTPRLIQSPDGDGEGWLYFLLCPIRTKNPPLWRRRISPIVIRCSIRDIWQLAYVHTLRARHNEGESEKALPFQWKRDLGQMDGEKIQWCFPSRGWKNRFSSMELHFRCVLCMYVCM